MNQTSSMTTAGEVVSWLRSGVEWSDEASRDKALEAIEVIDKLSLAESSLAHATRELRYLRKLTVELSDSCERFFR